MSDQSCMREAQQAAQAQDPAEIARTLVILEVEEALGRSLSHIEVGAIDDAISGRPLPAATIGGIYRTLVGLVKGRP